MTFASSTNTFTCPQCASPYPLESIDAKDRRCSECGTELVLLPLVSTPRSFPLEWRLFSGLLSLLIIISCADTVSVLLLNQLSLSPDIYMTVYSHIGIIIAVIMFLSFMVLLQYLTPIENPHGLEGFVLAVRETVPVDGKPFHDRGLLKRVGSIFLALSIFTLVVYALAPAIKYIHETIPWHVSCDGTSKLDIEAYTNHIVHCVD